MSELSSSSKSWYCGVRNLKVASGPHEEKHIFTQICKARTTTASLSPKLQERESIRTPPHRTSPTPASSIDVQTTWSPTTAESSPQICIRPATTTKHSLLAAPQLSDTTRDIPAAPLRSLSEDTPANRRKLLLLVST